MAEISLENDQCPKIFVVLIECYCWQCWKDIYARAEDRRLKKAKGFKRLSNTIISVNTVTYKMREWRLQDNHLVIYFNSKLQEVKVTSIQMYNKLKKKM